MGRDVTLEVDDRGRTTVPKGDRKALGIEGKPATLDAEVEVLEVDRSGCSWNLENLPDPVVDIMDESQLQELREVQNSENTGEDHGN